MGSIIKLHNVTKKFKDQLILENVSTFFNDGKIIGITGENGSGKSVLFKLIAGFEQPNLGEIIVDDVNITKKNVFPQNMGVLIEDPSFLGNLSGFQNLALLASIQNKINENTICDLLKSVGLYRDKDKKVKNYSLGMKKKLAIVQAIMEDQNILLLDEPMNALDEESVKMTRNLLQDLTKKGKSIFITSHNKDDIESLCEEVYKIKNRKLEKM